MSRRLDVVSTERHPAYVVWELTLRCDHACHHCGSRAGVARDVELTTAEALEVVDRLAARGTREIVLIGGEAYLHEGFIDIVGAISRAGIVCAMTTGGRGVTAELAVAMKAAGMQHVSVSIDGLAPNHDAIRNAKGSFDAALACLGHLRAAGIRLGSNININRQNRGDLEDLYLVLRAAGVRAWQLQITSPLGRAADRTDLTLQPYDLLELLPRIAALKERAYADGVTVMPGNNLGYFGPEEALLRSLSKGGRDHFAGCQAGRFVMGIESDGTVKGCPSLQTAAYALGHVFGKGLDGGDTDAPGYGFNRTDETDRLWGFCKTCDFASVCRGGCSFTAHAVLGRPGNNPYCHYRARTLAKQGLRERLVPLTAATGVPFDNGTFEIVVEPIDAEEPAFTGDALVQISRRPARMRERH